MNSITGVLLLIPWIAKHWFIFFPSLLFSPPLASDHEDTESLHVDDLKTRIRHEEDTRCGADHLNSLCDCSPPLFLFALSFSPCGGPFFVLYPSSFCVFVDGLNTGIAHESELKHGNNMCMSMRDRRSLGDSVWNAFC